MKNVFVIGIGGTGMRCIENFIHLCAIGMFDDTTVHMLALDTDNNNGNFRRLSKLVDLYQNINGGNAKADTLFSAKLKYYQFSPNYGSNDCTCNKIIDKLSATSAVIDKKDQDQNLSVKLSDLVDLFIRPEVCEMPLAHGYRAQTQMGSMLMYYAIQEEAYNARTKEDSQLRQFLHELMGGQGTGHQVFVFGSVFGGTGASTIPVIPHAFAKAAEILGLKGTVDSNHFASVVLTNYFQFNIADIGNEVVAKSDKFALNSQAALKFYANDQTIQKIYKRLYLLGREDIRSIPSGGTGGASQCNPVDYIELMAAFAAYDFFKSCDALAANPKLFEENEKNKFVYRAISADGMLGFSNFAEDEDAKMFMRKLGIMTAASCLNSAYDYFENLRKDVVTFDERLLTNYLKPYFQYFGLEPWVDEKGVPQKGWLNQIVESAHDGGFKEGAFFKPELFNLTTEKEFKNYKFNERLYNMESAPSFSVGLLTNKFDVVKKRFNEIKPDRNNSLDALLERTYLTLRNLYFNE